MDLCDKCKEENTVCYDCQTPEMFECYECDNKDCDYRYREFNCIIERWAKENKMPESNEGYCETVLAMGKTRQLIHDFEKAVEDNVLSGSYPPRTCDEMRKNYRLKKNELEDHITRVFANFRLKKEGEI